MINYEYLTFDVKWSSHLEDLADELLHSWQDTVRQNPDPFGKVCIVVNDSSTENWLKQYFLLHCKDVMMNLKFVRLPEFINDWLAAELHEVSPLDRKASEHPYSTGVLTWRIYNILSKENPNGDLKELVEYIGEDKKHLRCLALSEKLAILYDDYLNSRGQMLRNWEKGMPMDSSKEVLPWQISLYQRLVRENNHTYAVDYEDAFSTGLDAKKAFEHGFPKYLAVHVFDIPFMPEATLHLLEKISEAFPEKMTFWHFNPSTRWLGDTKSKKEAIRKIRELLHEGKIPSDKSIADILKESYDFPEYRLFGALASGARAMIYNLCRDSEGRADAIGDTDSIDELKGKKIFVHNCYSPRRELEVIKNGLLEFFDDDENKEACPHDVAVLCADWENYAPIIESIFSSDPKSEGYIPVTVAGKAAGDTPFFQSFWNLLSFRENRFEAENVFALLDFPAICKKYGLEDENAISALRNMVGKANIRWGYDDADVRHILDVEENAEHYPFTWQRGLDRMTAELFHGFSKDEYTLVDAGGEIGEIRPCGFVEGEREEYAASLWKLIANLKWLRNTFAEERKDSPEEIQKDLLEVIKRFYDETDEKILKEINKARQAVRDTAENIKDAGITEVGTEVFLTSMLSALSGSVPGMRTAGDSVLFAPLNCSNAVPCKFVWICGLNDGAFPKMEYRASYDLIGKYPSFFDATTREKDAYALLKAALSARKQLCFSYIGMDNRTNEDMPPSVLLTDLKDYFSAEKIPYTEYKHPMHAYSRRYFMGNSGLPTSYSPANESIMEELNKKHEVNGIIPFPLSENSITEIKLDDLVEFFSGPNQYLFRHKEKIYVSETQYGQVNSRDCLEVKLDKHLQSEIVRDGKVYGTAAKSQVEAGNAPDARSAETAIKSLCDSRKRLFFFSKNSPYNCNSLSLADAYGKFESAEKEKKDHSLELNVSGHQISLQQKYAIIEIPCKSGNHKFMIFFDLYYDKDSAKNRTLLRYLAANASEGGIAAVLFGPEGNPRLLQELTVGQAVAMLAEVIALSGKPLPSEFPDYRKASPKEDALPKEWQAKLKLLLNAAKINKQGSHNDKQ